MGAMVAPSVSTGMMGGGMMGGGMMGSGAFGGGVPFGGASNVRVTPSVSPFNTFPFFGGGAWGGWGGWGAPEVITQPVVLPPPIPPQVLGPVQIRQTVPFSNPVVTSSRTVFVDGTPTVVTSPMIVEYNWPSKVAAAKAHHNYMRTKSHTK
jgi:hypothetical protein